MAICSNGQEPVRAQLIKLNDLYKQIASLALRHYSVSVAGAEVDCGVVNY